MRGTPLPRASLFLTDALTAKPDSIVGRLEQLQVCLETLARVTALNGLAVEQIERKLQLACCFYRLQESSHALLGTILPS